MNGVAHLETVALGSLFAHRVSFDEAVEYIVSLVRAKQGGYVVTPNVDHVCVAALNPEFERAHRAASLSTVDGTPLMWLSRACRTPLPEKISGSDLMLPVLTRAEQEGFRVAFFGGSETASKAAAETVLARFPTLNMVEQVWPLYRPQESSAELLYAIDAVRRSEPDIIFVAMGTPNQELFLHEYHGTFETSVLIGIGAGLDFLSGAKARAPRWMQRAGMEWLFRLAHEPKRLAYRYLVRDRAFFLIAVRQILRSRRSSVSRPSLGSRPSVRSRP
jgi:N-acetylglucosaminyldiphosphoundecaprenol N-acetyl-beta-D-mannosaminyltransferase